MASLREVQDPRILQAEGALPLIAWSRQSLGAPEKESLTLRLMARSPESPVAQLVMAHAGDLRMHGVELEILLHRVDLTSDDTRQRLGDLALQLGPEGLRRHVRIDPSSRFVDAREAVGLGREYTWVGAPISNPKGRLPTEGKSMRRGDNPASDALMRVTFLASWAAATPLPTRTVATLCRSAEHALANPRRAFLLPWSKRN